MLDPHDRKFHPFQRLPAAGWIVLFVGAGLTLMGLVALSSAGRSFADDPAFILKRQTIWTVLAVIVFSAAYCVNLDALRRGTWVFGAMALALLGIVLVPSVGLEVNGARRWLDLGLMRMQPSDAAKPAFVLLMAHYLAGQQRSLRTLGRGFLVPCLMIGLFCGLIILEPDFGTAALFGAVGGCLLFVAGVPYFYLIPTALSGLAAFGFMVYHDPVRLERITAFLDVEGNRADASYQLWQGLLALGVGGTNGVGLGNGRQQLSFLPEAHTDFIFPIIGEEMGLPATLGILLGFAMLFGAVMWNLRRAPNLFQFTLVLGSALFIILQALVNLGVVTGLLPTKGMSLPFISYGGSNLLVMFGFLGLILNAFRRWEAPPLPKPLEL